MRPARTITGTNQRTGIPAWLGVVAVLLLQAQLAFHPGTDHDLSSLADEVCEVCLKLDSSSNAPPGDVVTLVPAPASPAEIIGSEARLSARFVAFYGARAPPLS